MAEDTQKDRGNLFDNFSQDLDLENEESDFSEMSDPNDPQYEPGRADVDSDSDEQIPRSRSRPAVGKGVTVKRGAVSKGKGNARSSKAAKSSSVASSTREPIICTEGSDVDYS